MLVSRTARWVEEKRNEMEIQLCEKKREGRDLPTFLSAPLIKFMHFNWSKLNFAFSFFFFSFLFVFIYFFFDLFLFFLFIYFLFLSLWLFWPFALLLRVYYLSTVIFTLLAHPFLCSNNPVALALLKCKGKVRKEKKVRIKGKVRLRVKG